MDKDLQKAQDWLNRPRKDYVVIGADRHGQFYESEFATFAEALADMRRMDADRAQKGYEGYFMVNNRDNVDLGWHDGLTDEEREEL